MAATWVESLRPLQKIDMRIRGLNCKKRIVPGEIAKLNAEGMASKQSVLDAKAAIQNVERKIHQNENRMSGLEDEIRRLQQKTPMIKKNTEYQAMLVEIEKRKRAIGECESDILQLLDAVEAAKVAYRKCYKEAENKIASVKTQIAEYKLLLSDIDQELAELAEKRIDAGRKIDQVLLARYNALLNANDGEPLTQVLDGTCSNCNLKLTPQTMMIVRKGGEAVCDNCGHFVYSEEAQL
ncbi:MAG: hypothetical protein PHS41_04565 [Victivallaceae bacterium]|nr:hypothetical protein [Victivallaceae bacterium]